VGRECKNVGLIINAKKTLCLSINIENPPSLHTTVGTEPEHVDEFKYLGSWVKQTERDIAVRKSLAWQALNGMSRVWRSSLISELKVWALTQAMENSLEVKYTTMLHKVLNIHWSRHTPDNVLYGDVPYVNKTVASRRLQLSGHCFHQPELSIQRLLV
jgi:hypothetical protein